MVADVIIYAERDHVSLGKVQVRNCYSNSIDERTRLSPVSPVSTLPEAVDETRNVTHRNNCGKPLVAVLL